MFCVPLLMAISLRDLAVSSIPLAFLTFEHLIEFRYKVSQLVRVHFFADLLRECSPITRLWGHV